MSPLSRVQSSKANSVLSEAPSPPACIVLEDEAHQNFPNLRAWSIDFMAAAPSLRTLIMLRPVKFPNEPSPISEHSRPKQTVDSKLLSGAANPGCSRLSAGYHLLGGNRFSQSACRSSRPLNRLHQPSDAPKPAACYP